MSTTDTRAAFEAWALEHGFNLNFGPDGKNYISGHTQSIWEPWQAATEAAKATGTAELPPLPIYYGTSAMEAERAHKYATEYGQACFEAARQPAPVMLSDDEILTMASQHGVESREFSDECVISLVRAALAATNRSQP